MRSVAIIRDSGWGLGIRDIKEEGDSSKLHRAARYAAFGESERAHEPGTST